jgi:hypothetical protein
MSQVMDSIDAKGYLSGWLQGLKDMYTADVRAIPEDKWNATFGGCTRPASELTADALGLLDWTSYRLRGEAAEDWQNVNKPAIAAKCSTRDGALECLNDCVSRFSESFKDANPANLNQSIQTPWGMETPLFMVAQIAVSHLWYHDGQLNYIQALLGDDKVHWMGD